jgi:hypothetical protein
MKTTAEKLRRIADGVQLEIFQQLIRPVPIPACFQLRLLPRVPWIFFGDQIGERLRGVDVCQVDHFFARFGGVHFGQYKHHGLSIDLPTNRKNNFSPERTPTNTGMPSCALTACRPGGTFITKNLPAFTLATVSSSRAMSTHLCSGNSQFA